MLMGFCHHCGARLRFDEKVYRKDTCPQCNSDVLCCFNCREYAETAPNQCREREIDPVSVKDRRNFCEHFRLSDRPRPADGARKAAEARTKLEALFKK
jgi:hypothetical protein